MGKYMRKAKISGEVAVMEVSQASLGVQTRARTLALQRLQASTATTTTTNSGECYLQLRSRRLEKPPLLVAGNNESRKQQQAHKESCKSNHKPRTSSKLGVVSVNSGSIGSVSLSCSKTEHGYSTKEAIEVGGQGEETQNNNSNDGGLEASFGENFLEFEGRDRSTRESTPCSLIRDSDAVGTPGSTTRRASIRRIENMRRNMPATNEMEEFFASAEKQQQRLFAEKYNFDPVNELPLPGRYEWVKVNP